MADMLKEFRDFLMRGNLVELAVAFVMGLAFAALVTSFVDDLVLPIVAMIIGEPDFSGLTFTINDAVFRYGAFLTAAITFLTTAAAIFFFVVKPLDAIRSRTTTAEEEEPSDEERRQSKRWLIQQEKSRAGHQRTSDREHLLLATRQMTCELIPALSKYGKSIEDLVHRAGELSRRVFPVPRN